MSLDVPSKNCYFIHAKRAELLKFSRHVLEINSDPTHAPDFRIFRFGGLRRESSGAEYQRVQTTGLEKLEIVPHKNPYFVAPCVLLLRKVNNTVGNLISDPTHVTDFSFVAYFTKKSKILEHRWKGETTRFP